MLNKIMLIGNVTRDPELRYTPGGNANCSFSVAVNRRWRNDAGEKQEDVEFFNVVAWSKLGETCNEFLAKGSKVYVEGRLQTRSWEKDGEKKYRTEVVASVMTMLDSRRDIDGADGPDDASKAPF